MKVLVTTESRFERTPDGTCWTVSTAGYEFWQRYLDVFDEVRIAGRMRDVPIRPSASVRADGPKVSLVPLPCYVGPWDYARKYFQLRRAVRSMIDPADAVIIRAPGMAGTMVVAALCDCGHPYGMEVVGDPWNVFARGSVRTVLRPLLRQWITADLKRQCAGACAVAYVTSADLQKSYPASATVLMTAYSSINLPDEAFAAEPRNVRPKPEVSQIIYVGTLEQLYKAPDILIDAVAIANAKGANIGLTIIGEGKHLAELQQRAASRGLSNQVRFLGHVSPGKPIRDELDRADLFVLPSRQEGLPRAMIEAMARGLPCIGSDVGGIPELLAPTECVPAGDGQTLATKLVEVLADPQRLADLSRVNLQKAKEYNAKILRPRRQALYRTVKEATLRWQKTKTLTKPTK